LELKKIYSKNNSWVKEGLQTEVAEYLGSDSL
jgi:hypothetical protein